MTDLVAGQGDDEPRTGVPLAVDLTGPLVGDQRVQRVVVVEKLPRVVAPWRRAEPRRQPGSRGEAARHGGGRPQTRTGLIAAAEPAAVVREQVERPASRVDEDGPELRTLDAHGRRRRSRA